MTSDELSTGVTVSDATVLSNFAHVDSLGLLCSLPDAVTVEAVRAEVPRATGTHPYLTRATAMLGDEIPVLRFPREIERVRSEYDRSLDSGEGQAVAVAELTDGTAATDDLDARTVTKRHDIEITGSIGLLVHLVRTDRLTVETADEYLTRWVDDGDYRAPSRDIHKFLD